MDGAVIKHTLHACVYPVCKRSRCQLSCVSVCRGDEARTTGFTPSPFPTARAPCSAAQPCQRYVSRCPGGAVHAIALRHSGFVTMRRRGRCVGAHRRGFLKGGTFDSVRKWMDLGCPFVCALKVKVGQTVSSLLSPHLCSPLPLSSSAPFSKN